MYTLKLKHEFCASHQLTHAYSKECNENLHGHNFKVEVKIQSLELINGMIVDFKKIKEIINQLDHKNLNELLDFEPTAENISKFLYNEIEKIFSKEDEEIEKSSYGVPENYYIIEVTIWENDDSSITYSI